MDKVKEEGMGKGLDGERDNGMDGGDRQRTSSSCFIISTAKVCGIIQYVLVIAIRRGYAMKLWQ